MALVSAVFIQLQFSSSAVQTVPHSQAAAIIDSLPTRPHSLCMFPSHHIRPPLCPCYLLCCAVVVVMMQDNALRGVLRCKRHSFAAE